MDISHSPRYGPTFDSIYWKLASNSAVFLIAQPGNPPEPYYMQWFTPLLTAGKHYVPISSDALDDAIAWYGKQELHCVYVCVCVYNAHIHCHTLSWPHHTALPYTRITPPHIHITLNHIHTAPHRCEANELRCEQIAANAYELMRCSVTLETAQRYLAKVIKLVHDMQAPVVHGAHVIQQHPSDGKVW